MKTLKLTAEHFKQSNSYWKDYIGTVDVSDYQWHIEIDSNLWYVKFNKIKASWRIVAFAGSGIKAGEGIEAGWGIEAGEGIEAGLSITCKLSLSFSYKIFAGICYWRNISDSEKTITCGKKEGTGVVEYGILVETGLPDKKLEWTMVMQDVA